MARMTLEEIKGRPSTIDWTRVNATTDGDIDRQAKEDGSGSRQPPKRSLPRGIRCVGSSGYQSTTKDYRR